MTASHPTRRSSPFADIFQKEVTAWVVLAVSLILTVLGAYVASQYVQKRANDRFMFVVEDARQRIRERILNYEQVLRGAVALNMTSGKLVSRKEWHQYVSALDIQKHFPGIQGIGFTLMLRPEDVEKHEAAIRAEGFPDYVIKPEGVRQQYSSIIYIEPFDWRNQRAFGYDMYSEPARRAAMEQAADSGFPALTGRVTLVQETEQDIQPGFLMYLPFYTPGMPTSTVDERRQALIGFVYSPFRMSDLMHGILGYQPPDVGFELYDGNQEQSADTLLYATHQESGLQPPSHTTSTTLDLNGHIWTARFHSRPSFDAAMSSSLPLFIGVGGSIMDLLLFIIIWSLAGERKRVQAKTEEMTQELRTSAQRLRLAQESAALGTWDYHLADKKLIWDDRMYAIYRVSRDEFTGTYDDWASRLHPDDREQASREIRLAIEGVQGFNMQFRIVLPDQSVRVIEAHAIVLRDEAGNAERVIGVNRDITGRAHIEERLRLAASVFDHAYAGITITDAEERIIEVNPTFCTMTGYSRDEAIGKTPRILQSGHHQREFYEEMWGRLNREGFWQGEIWNRRKNGEVYAELLNISAVHNPEGQLTHYVATFSDISLLKEQQYRLEQMAHHDALTQLPNRVLLADRMYQALAYVHRHAQLLAVCYLDLDGFKPVNDQYGHMAGDQLLVDVAQRIHGHLRENDTVARIGGDEFVMLMSDLGSIEECKHALDRLLSLISAPYTVGEGHVVFLSASIGVTIFPNDPAEAETLLHHADWSMYQAKQAGGNRYHVFDVENDGQQVDSLS